MPPETPETTPVEEEANGRSLTDTIKENRGFFIGLAVAMALMGLCLVPTFLFLLVRGTDGNIFNFGEEPTPFATSAAANISANTSIVQGIGPSDTVSVTLDIPAALTINGRSHTVQPQVIPADGAWNPDLDEGEAAWVYGTVINYVFGLPDTNETRALLESVGPGDEFEMTTQNGVPFVFSFESKESVPANNRDIYNQQSPGATIILTGGGQEDRTVVKGRYVVSDTDSNFQANTCEVGEVCQVGNLQLVVTGASYDPSQGSAPEGFAFYRVDYQVENVGGAAVNTNNLKLALTDDIGNQYALSPVASQSGNYPVLSGPLNVGQVLQATAGYRIPEGLESQTVQWVITDAETGAQIQVVIDFGGGSGAVEQTSITLIGATITDDRTALLMDGQITNLGSQPVVVNQRDLSLRTGDGASFLLLATNPEFPWTVPPAWVCVSPKMPRFKEWILQSIPKLHIIANRTCPCADLYIICYLYQALSRQPDE